MPKNYLVRPFPNAYILRKNQKPLSRVRDLESALTVEIQSISGIDYTLLEFTHCAHFNKAPDYKGKIENVPNYLPGSTEHEAAVKGIMEGTALWQGLETIHFKIKVTGCTRIFTHQLVRQRIGITFSQQCSGDMDWRHHDVLLPRPIYSQTLINTILQNKYTYCHLLDNCDCSIQESRYILPQCLETFIYFDASLATIKALYAKRTCTMTQTWEMILFAHKLKTAILKKAPHLEKAFISPCELGKCWYQGAKEGKEETFLYQPDKIHDRFDWHPDSYIYSGDCKTISSRLNPIETEYYEEFDKITEYDWIVKYKKLKAWL